jgi:hypothetical protein
MLRSRETSLWEEERWTQKSNRERRVTEKIAGRWKSETLNYCYAKTGKWILGQDLC